MKKLAFLLSLVSCSTPPKPTIPALTLQNATELLQRDPKADNWLKYVQKNNTKSACEYKIDLPDQTNHPSQIDLDHIVWCGNQPSPKEFDASVSFEFDKDTQHWVITRFAS
jgi:hypothetical protein